VSVSGPAIRLQWYGLQQTVDSVSPAHPGIFFSSDDSTSRHASVPSSGVHRYSSQQRRCGRERRQRLEVSSTSSSGVGGSGPTGAGIHPETWWPAPWTTSSSSSSSDNPKRSNADTTSDFGTILPAAASTPAAAGDWSRRAAEKGVDGGLGSSPVVSQRRSLRSKRSPRRRRRAQQQRSCSSSAATTAAGSSAGDGLDDADDDTRSTRLFHSWVTTFWRRERNIKAARRGTRGPARASEEPELLLYDDNGGGRRRPRSDGRPRRRAWQPAKLRRRRRYWSDGGGFSPVEDDARRTDSNVSSGSSGNAGHAGAHPLRSFTARVSRILSPRPPPPPPSDERPRAGGRAADRPTLGRTDVRRRRHDDGRDPRPTDGQTDRAAGRLAPGRRAATTGASLTGTTCFRLLRQPPAAVASLGRAATAQSAVYTPIVRRFESNFHTQECLRRLNAPSQRCPTLRTLSKLLFDRKTVPKSQLRHTYRRRFITSLTNSSTVNGVSFPITGPACLATQTSSLCRGCQFS